MDNEWLGTRRPTEAERRSGAGHEASPFAAVRWYDGPMATSEDLVGRMTVVLDEMASEKKKAKEKELGEAWTKPAAISIVVVAVLGATATQRSGSFGTRALKHLNAAIYHQVEASDQWSYYQAKSTKGAVYQQSVETVRVLAAPGAAEAEKLVAGGHGKLKQYEVEKEEIQAKAREFEKQRDEEKALAESNSATGAQLNLSVSMYQVAVALASICLVMKRKTLWYGAMVMALPATAWLAYTLFALAPPR
jgi:hypothetical protein